MNLKNYLLAAASAITPTVLALLGGLYAPHVQAKQCIFNKGAYTMHVHWFRRADISVQQTPNDHGLGRLRALSAPVQTASITSGFGDCTNTDEMLVAVTSVISPAGYFINLDDRASIVGSLPFFNRATPMKTHFNNGQADVYKPVAPVVCVVEHPGYCKSAGMEPAFSPPGNILLIIEPPSTQYLDFAGTVFSVRWFLGGPIR